MSNSTTHDHTNSNDIERVLNRYTRHADLWFADGSVILRAESTLFRVHMSQLSRHSVFFRDMFNLPQPSSTSGSSRRLHIPCSLHQAGDDLPDELEGCPVIHLHDSAQDLTSLLVALYDGPTFGNNDRDDFLVVSGILRLSTKYIIDSLRAKALAHLSVAWPSTLQGWESREDRARIWESEGGIARGHLYPSPVEVITLAREINATSLLPSAFYDLSRYTYAQIYEPFSKDPLYPMIDLSPTDTQKLTLGKESSSNFITSLIHSMSLSSPSYSNAASQASPSHPTHLTHRRISSRGSICTSASACRKDFAELVELATQHYLFDREKGFSDPLYAAEELGQLKSEIGLSNSGEEGVMGDCKACARSLEAWAAKERERIWRLIPQWFRLDS